MAFNHRASPTGYLEKLPLLVRLRADLEAELGAEAYTAALKRGSARDLDMVVAELLAEHEAE